MRRTGHRPRRDPLGSRRTATRRRETKSSGPQHRSAQVTRGGTQPDVDSGTRPKDQAAEPEALVLTFEFDPGDSGEPYAATVRATGRRAGVRGKPRANDSFTQEERIDRVVPGSGPICVTSWIYGLQPGEWSVTASLHRIDRIGDHPGPRARSSRHDDEPLSTVGWSWRRRELVPGSRVALVKTRWALTAPLAIIPAVIPGSVPLLVAIGAIIGLIVQAWILGTKGFPIDRALTVTLVASLAGLVAAKVWFAVLNPGKPIFQPGWAVDGFMVAAPLAALAALLALGSPVGTYFDASAPALFLTVAFGRVGCFFTGCCAGRPTAARWGLWSSDRRIAARRVPTQLIESAVGLAIALATAPLVLASALPVEGGVFVLALAAYFLARQSLLRVRAEPRGHLWDRHSLAVQMS